MTDSLPLDYYRIVQKVWDEGREVAPRGLVTHELPGATIILTDPTRALCTCIGRSLSTKVAAVEALSLIGGFSDPALIVKASDRFSAFAEGGNFWGGYGMRTRAQVPNMIRRLQADPSTRRAQITFWDPVYDGFIEDSRDYPCTTSLQLMMRDDKLECHVHMRSNDVWRGMPYDIFVFTQFQCAVAGYLNMQVGSYYHHASSLHMYQLDFSDFIECAANGGMGPQSTWGLIRPSGYEWEDITRQIRDHVRIGEFPSSYADAFDDDMLERYVSWLPT